MSIEPAYKILTLSILSQKVSQIIFLLFFFFFFFWLAISQQRNGWSPLVNKLNHPPRITRKLKEQNPITQYAYETFQQTAAVYGEAS